VVVVTTVEILGAGNIEVKIPILVCSGLVLEEEEDSGFRIQEV
jgi:hypothetical protein